MLHHIKYRGKSILREKTTLFWSFAFSFVLGTLFYLAFSDMNSNLDTIETALVMQEQGREAVSLKSVLGMISDSEESLISVKEMSEKEAEKKLSDKKISGIFLAGKEAELVVAENGMEQSILQGILEQFQSRVNFISDVSKDRPEKLGSVVKSMMQNANAVYVRETALGGENPDGFIQYYFALIAMTCLFGCYLGMDVATQLQANVGMVGARRTVSSTSKIKMFLCDICTVCVADFVSAILLLCYLKFVLKLEIGDDWPRMLLVVLTGCVVGIAIGAWVGSMSKANEGVKAGILTAVGLFSSFLSGLMIGGIKGWLEEYCPIINRLNPASVITDALFSISMYPDNARYYKDILTLGVFALVLFGVVFVKMRRVRYDSI